MYELKNAGGGFKSASDILTDIRSAAADAGEVAAACRRAVEATDGPIGAWIALDWPAVERQVRALESRSDWRRLPLAGLPVAVKDIFDTVDFPTAYGSEIYAGNHPVWDAGAVAALRDAGAIIAGKTVSTEFAYWKAGKTRNPHDATRSPGGSSSGSAAAIAAGMAPLAIGSQTAASTIRPASYCGIVGFKPTIGRISLAGVKSLANSLDTVGVFARNVADAGLIAAVLTRRDALGAVVAMPDAPSFRLAVAAEWMSVEEDTLARTRAAAQCLAEAGAAVSESEAPAGFTDLAAVQTTIMTFEAARELAFERINHAASLSPQLNALFDASTEISGAGYDAACGQRDACLNALDDLFAGASFLLAPSTTAEAPLFEDGTGSPDLSRAWTLLGLPSISVPMGRGPNGLPLGLQVAARPGDDHRLLQAAAWIEARLAGSDDA